MEAAMTTKDRRKGIRRFVDIPAEFSVQGRSYQGRIKNLNSAGFFIETENSFSEGQVISSVARFLRAPDGNNKIDIIDRVDPRGIWIKSNCPKNKKCIMRKLTLQLFQLFLAVFATYVVLFDGPIQDILIAFQQNLFVVILCLVCMFLIGRHKGTQYGFYEIPAYRKPGQVFALHAAG